MTGILLLIPVALGLGLLGLFAFFWAVGHGQFDDLDGAALRIFIDDAGDSRSPAARDGDSRTPEASDAD
jgi:cbb3-type cytochrome oxidase maturation protein